MGARHVIALGLLACAAAAQASGSWTYASSGVPLRAGVYGRIHVRGAPPPLIAATAVVVRQPIRPVQGEPWYFYLPAGQVRKWSVYCRRYNACERPVYFVRMDNTPGKLGRWNRREKELHRRGSALLSADADGHL